MTGKPKNLRWRRAFEIDDDAFWKALRSPGRGRTNSQLRAAIAAGRAGDPEAYRMLAAWHRTQLADEWQRCRTQAAAAPALSPEARANLLRNRINIWHNLVIDFGAEIDWNIRHLGTTVPGFHYFAWILPAMHQMIRDGDDAMRGFVERTIRSYYRALPEIRDGWVSKRPSASRVGGNLCSRGKTRMLVPSYLAMIQDDQSDVDVLAAALKLLLGIGRTACGQMDWEATQPDANGNISIAGTSALFEISKLFPEFRESPRWAARAEERMAFFARRSFFADGGYCERVWGYGVAALSDLIQVYVRAQQFGGLGARDREVRRRLRMGARWYAKTLGPLERKPQFGDGSPAPKIDPRPLDAAAALFPPGCDRFLGVDRRRSYLLKPSGFAILRNGDDAQAVYANISFGKYAGWHAHYDLLSMNLWGFDTPLLEELDRWGPYHCPLDILVRAPEAHNLFLVDGMVYDPRGIAAHDVQWHSTPAVDCFTACHRAYRYEVFSYKGPGCFNMNGVVRRTVIFVKDPGYALVVDSVFDENHAGFNRAVSQYWHSPFPFRVLAPGVVRTAGEVGCLLAFARTDCLRRLDCTTAFAGDEVEHTLPFRDRFSLRARRWGRVEEPGKPGFATLLRPFRGELPAARIKPLTVAGGEPYRAEGYEIETECGRDRIILNPECRPDLVYRGQPVPGRGLIVLGNRRGRIEWR